jgi:RecB family exonuclease
VPAEGTLKLLAVPDRAAEVRAALRWLKRRLVHDKMRPGQVALLARSIPAYRPFITQIAAEFGLPIRLVDGLPLRANPAVVALLDLLRLMLPRDQGDAQPALPRRPLVEAWRSPYFDWSALPHAGAAAPIGIAPGDADALDAAARWGLVIDGLEQWAEVLQHLTRRSPENRDDEERDISAAVPTGDRARDLWDKLSRFVRRLTPPEGEHPYHDFCRWLEDLIGPDPTLASPRYPLPPEPTALQVVAAARDAPAPIAERDVAALQALKDVLRGLVWAEEALETEEQVDFVRFLEELVGAVEATSYRLPVRPERQEILVADVVQARGLPLRAVAVLGLAEGEFPAVLGEDPFLRDADRQQLREQFDVPLEPSIASAEAEFFYETLTRPSEKLLLTRPRLADNGAPWQASPYWEEVCRLVQVEPQTLTSEHRPAPDQVASWPELLESLSAHPPQPRVEAWLAEAAPERQAALDAAVALLQARTRAPDDERRPGAHDGDVTALGGTFARRFGPQHTWSASRLEAYRTCPFFFFVGSVLKLEPRAEPAAGLDARQLGNIYHHILEDVYQHPTVSDPADLSQLLEALPVVAKQVLDAAPAREGFRETAWWDHTREEIEDDVERSLQALAELPGAFVPHRFEAAFGLLGQPALVVSDGEDQFRLRGFIDRVDRAPDGCLRVIDYKTAGPYVYNNSAVRQGKKLQLPLYALGARDALGLGEPAEGFYWHVRHAEASPFKLAKFGPQEAMEQTVEYAWEAVRAARQGHFVPQTPDGGCPSYCPAAQMCWHYQPGYGG